MPTYLIERTIPGAGAMTDADWSDASSTSNQVIADLGGVTWLHSYVTADKVFCVYDADSEAVVREHGKRGGFPVDSVIEVSRLIDPSTAGAQA